MTRSYKYLALALICVGSEGIALAADVTTTGTTNIIQPVTIAETTPLVFGLIARPSAGAGTVTIAGDTGVTAVTGTNAAAVGGGTSAAVYTITGEPGQTVAVTTDATFDMLNGTEALTVTLTPSIVATAVLDATAGTSPLTVGGSFPISATTVPGAYTGTFNVSVNYQ